jgi:hypothetical protein
VRCCRHCCRYCCCCRCNRRITTLESKLLAATAAGSATAALQQQLASAQQQQCDLQSRLAAADAARDAEAQRLDDEDAKIAEAAAAAEGRSDQDLPSVSDRSDDGSSGDTGSPAAAAIIGNGRDIEACKDVEVKQQNGIKRLISKLRKQ